MTIQIDREIERCKHKIAELEEKVKQLEKRKKKMLDIRKHEHAVVCPDCDGSGSERFTDAAGSRDWRPCSTCEGFKFILPLTCEKCGRTIGTDMIHVRRRKPVWCPWCGGNLR